MGVYDDILNNDGRYTSARSTSQRKGSAHSGWAPKEKSKMKNLAIDLGLVLVAAAIVFIAVKALNLQ